MRHKPRGLTGHTTICAPASPDFYPLLARRADEISYLARMRRHAATVASLIVSLSAATHAAAQADHQTDHTHDHQHRHDTVTDHSRFTTNRPAAEILPLPTEDDAFFFVVYGDRTGGPADGVKILDQAVSDTNLLEPDLVMTVGDLVEGYNTTEAWMAQMREFKGIMDKLYCPWFPVAGNHDIYWRGNNTPDGEHEQHFETHFGPLWYAFEHKDCYFIVLYSDEGNPDTGEKSISKPETQKMSPEQFAWLAETLDKAKDAKHVFLFLHHPRWTGGNYGNDWDRVHNLLVQAGNVSAVFAGHIHRARFDPRDGIEYVTLATVGGVQTGKAPDAGYLHHFDIVTVREDHIALASIPVGGMQDVRAITGTVSNETGRLADTRPSVAIPLHVTSDGTAEGLVAVTVTNPVSRPIDLTLSLDSADSRWSVSPDHNHAQIPPGGSRTFEFAASRLAGLDIAFRPLEVVLNMDYLAETARFNIPEIRADVPLTVDLSAPPMPARETAAAFDGKTDHIRIESATIPVPDGPLTLECWMRARSFGNRVGLVAKTESSDYGIFVSKGVPEFSIFLGDRYAAAGADAPILKPGTWHHVAGVYDGAEIRLYVDGTLITTTKRSGKRRTNNRPLMIGADVSNRSQPTSFFDGDIDAVRLTAAAVYTGDSFTPARRPAATPETYLLLNMDGLAGPWLYDESGRGAHPVVTNTVELVGAE